MGRVVLRPCGCRRRRNEGPGSPSMRFCCVGGDRACNNDVARIDVDLMRPSPKSEDAIAVRHNNSGAVRNCMAGMKSSAETVAGIREIGCSCAAKARPQRPQRAFAQPFVQDRRKLPSTVGTKPIMAPARVRAAQIEDCLARFGIRELRASRAL